jgi:hypothetical protein
VGRERLSPERDVEMIEFVLGVVVLVVASSLLWAAAEKGPLVRQVDGDEEL